MRDRFDEELDRLTSLIMARKKGKRIEAEALRQERQQQAALEVDETDALWPSLDVIKTAVWAFREQNGYWPGRQDGRAGPYFEDPDFSELLWRDVNRRLKARHGGSLFRLVQDLKGE